MLFIKKYNTQDQDENVFFIRITQKNAHKNINKLSVCWYWS